MECPYCQKEVEENINKCECGYIFNKSNETLDSMLKTNSNKIIKSHYLGIIIGSTVIATCLAIFGLVYYNSPLIESDKSIGIFLLAISISIFIFSIFYYMKLIYTLWEKLQIANPRTTPIKAVGFLFISLFNLYWIFQCFWGFSIDFNNYIDSKKYPIKKISQLIPLTACILNFCISIATINNFIPIINKVPSLIAAILKVPSLIVFILIILFINQAINGINSLMDYENVATSS